MSVSKTQILNKSLTMAGASTVVSIDDDSNNARILRQVYDVALRSILSECSWNFAKKRALLSVSADTLAWYDTGESNIYIKPSDMVKIIRSNSPTAIWREEQDYIISDTSGLGLEYIYLVEDTTKFPALFVDAFCDKLTSDIAYMVVNSATLGEKYFKKYSKDSLPKATSVNSQTGTQQYLKDDAWELAKYSNGQPEA